MFLTPPKKISRINWRILKVHKWFADRSLGNTGVQRCERKKTVIFIFATMIEMWCEIEPEEKVAFHPQQERRSTSADSRPSSSRAPRDWTWASRPSSSPSPSSWRSTTTCSCIETAIQAVTFPELIFLQLKLKMTELVLNKVNDHGWIQSLQGTRVEYDCSNVKLTTI